MKRKITLILAMIMMLTCALTTSVFADSAIELKPIVDSSENGKISDHVIDYSYILVLLLLVVWKLIRTPVTLPPLEVQTITTLHFL